MDDAPPKRPSVERRSFFQDVTSEFMRSWKSLLSILISAIATGDDGAQTGQVIDGEELGREARHGGKREKSRRRVNG